jgi:ABC-type transporter Mla subunit MlaD
MTKDDDLVKQLRYLGDHASYEPDMHHTAADRIKQLAATNASLDVNLSKAITALQKVRDFVRDLEPYADQGHTLAPALHDACVILNELEGDKT